MTPPQISMLELEAAIAEEKAKWARSRASLAQLEHQRTMLGGIGPLGGGTGRIATWFVAAVLVGFVAWAAGTEPVRPSTSAPSTSQLSGH